MRKPIDGSLNSLKAMKKFLFDLTYCFGLLASFLALISAGMIWLVTGHHNPFGKGSGDRAVLCIAIVMSVAYGCNFIHRNHGALAQRPPSIAVLSKIAFVAWIVFVGLVAIAGNPWRY